MMGKSADSERLVEFQAIWVLAAGTQQLGAAERPNTIRRLRPPARGKASPIKPSISGSARSASTTR
jgi:hypothetical protein